GPAAAEPAAAAAPEEDRASGLVAVAEEPPAEGLDLLASRVRALEATVGELREELAALRRELGD
ncbi:MAG: hypothetical protein M3340_18505, partial [Actinomycetota bacterium]|nr:hypothetical protein [Actinomycetota bacterium]